MNIQDIAKAVGVSTATVSRVLNNSGYVKQETRAKVEQFIRENYYTPSAVARSLSKRDTGSIGVIVPDIENDFFTETIHAISEIAAKKGYNLFFFSSREDKETEHRALQSAKEQRLRGVIITPVANDDQQTKKYLTELVANHVPVVLLDRDLNASNFDGVFVDNRQGAYDAVTNLYQNGHQKIAIITGPETSTPGIERLAGYQEALAHCGLPVRQEYITQGNFMVNKAYQCTKDLLALPDPPTAIFSSSNNTTIGCIKYLYEKKVKLGQDVGLIGFDDIRLLTYVGIPISVVSRAVGEMGVSAMEILLGRMKEESFLDGKQKVVFSPHLILRGSEKKKIR